jgi:alpha-N-acetylglucosamine transferase
MERRTRYVLLLSIAISTILVLVYHTTTTNIAKESKVVSIFKEDRYDFQDELPALVRPDVSLATFRSHRPHNFIENTLIPQETFATFFCTRNGSLLDPYFAATLNLVYRNLWSPTIASKSRPFTVFVAPFVPQEQRDVLAGAGAVIQELPLVLWEPTIEGVYVRWRDQFSKLHMWYQTQYSRIAFMDSDAFPIANIDAVFDEVVEQKCHTSRMTLEDWAEPEKEGLCEYVFAGVSDLDGGVNGGFLVIKPNLAVHKRLLREYMKTDEYDNTYAEQTFLRWHFAENGPFPAQLLPRKYNAYFPKDDDEGKVSVVHEKLWSLHNHRSEWLVNIWDEGWQEMVEFFNSPAFTLARDRDGQSATINQKKLA